jgi:hypothetical protein
MLYFESGGTQSFDGVGAGSVDVVVVVAIGIPLKQAPAYSNFIYILIDKLI